MTSDVAMRACADYFPESVSRAVRDAWKASGGPDPKGKAVLLKPNLIKGALPEEAATTHPEILRAVIRYCKAEGAARIVVGESPGYQGFETAARKSRLMEVIEEEGIEFDDFSRAETVGNPKGKLVTSFKIAKAVGEADIVISLPKLKTHTLLQFTGAIKNLFGVVPGFEKSAYHFRFPDKALFGQMIVDLAALIDADFAVMDAIVGMEGPGPGSGDPRFIGQILASTNLLALDRCACRLVGYDPDRIGYLKIAHDSGLWLKPGEDARVDGPDPASVAVRGYKTLKGEKTASFQRLIPPPLHALIACFMAPAPRFNARKCVVCAGCVDICPAKALMVIPGAERGKRGKKIALDKKACIRCYCCHEVCPAEAIRVRGT
jgi:uncharacterized protein (DUF362 family)/ferredoxin